MNSELVDGIKSRGYWRVNIRPSVLPDKQLTLSECFDVVDRNTVSLRGWDYPHIPRRAGDDTGIDRLEDCVQAWTDWQNHREFWRMYPSTQFLHYVGLYEDWRDRDMFAAPPVRSWGRVIDGPTFGVLGNIWTLAEIFEFAARLARAGLYGSGATIAIELHNTRGRQLYIEDRSKNPFSSTRDTQADSISYAKAFSAAQLADPKTNTVEASHHIFDRFGWNPAPGQILGIVNELYERRFA